MLDKRRAYKVGTLAKHWECNPKQIYEMIDKGILKSFNIGLGAAVNKGGIRIPASEVERWEKEGNVRNTAETASHSDVEAETPMPNSTIQKLASDQAA